MKKTRFIASLATLITSLAINAQNITINELQVANNDMFLDPTWNFGGWMELYNPSSTDIDIAGYTITNDTENPTLYTVKTSTTIPAGGFALLWFEHNSLNPTQVDFKLDYSGGTIALYDTQGNLVDSYNYPRSYTRTSFARTTDGATTWGITAQPTPGYSNATSTFADTQLPAPVPDRQSGFFNGAITFRVPVPQGTTLHYTTDGTTPTLTNGSTTTLGVFATAQTTCYRFRLFADDKLPSPVVTRSFILNNPQYTLPIVNIVSKQDYIDGDSLGPLTQGIGLGTRGNGQSEPCNWNADWDRPVNFEYFVPNDDDSTYVCVLNQEADMESCGGWSRAYDPHSFKLKSTKLAEGVNFMNFPIFAAKPYNKNKILQIRNGGQDTEARMKDAVLQLIALSSGLNLDGQAYQPVLRFFNGKCYGLLNIREPNNRYYAYANYGLDDDEIDLFEVRADSGHWQMDGTRDAFDRLVALSQDIDNNLDQVSALLDIDEFINYSAVQLYLGNNDWPQNNFKAFRPTTENGRYRFILYDTDYAFSTDDPFGLMDDKTTYTWAELYDTDGLTGITRTQSIGYVSLFFNLMKNSEILRRFADTFCILAGSVYYPDRADEIVDSIAALIAPALVLEGLTPDDVASEIKTSLAERPDISLTALTGYTSFGLSENQQIPTQICTNLPNAAKLSVNDVEIPTNWFAGTLLAPAKLRARGPEHAKFRGWYALTRTTYNQAKLTYQAQKTLTQSEWNSLIAQSDLVSTASTLTLPTDTGKVYIAAFNLSTIEADQTAIRINEVCPSNNRQLSDAGSKGDWIELFNTASTAVNIAGMYLSNDSDNPTEWQIPDTADTYIPAYGHRLVWCDKQTGTRELHAPFRLNAASGIVVLTTADMAATDTLAWQNMDNTHTVGRYPDGGNSTYILDYPTAARTNIYTTTMTTHDNAAAIASIITTDLPAIETPPADNRTTNTSDNETYDLSGRRLPQDTALRPGIYIKSGKKVTIK